MDIAWMAWTWQSVIFFAFIAITLAVMTTLAVRYPETEHVGILRIPTTRGDRLFLSLLAAAFLHIIWIALFGASTIATVPNGAAGIEVSSLWLATLLSFVTAAIVFRFV